MTSRYIIKSSRLFEHKGFFIIIYHHKSNWKWIKDRSQTLKPVDKNIRKRIQDIGISKDFFFEQGSIVPEIISRINNFNYIRLRIFYTAKKITIEKIHPTEWGKIAVTHQTAD